MRGTEFGIRIRTTEVYSKTSQDALPSALLENEQRQQTLQYLAGYLDAASSITISDSTSFVKGKRMRSFVLRIEVARVQPEAIALTQITFPSYTGTQRLAEHPERSRWYAKSLRALSVLEELSLWLCIKSKHVELAREFQGASGKRSVDESLHYKDEMSKLNHTEVDSVRTPLELPYVAGFFDAHGAINIYQRSDHRALEVDMNTHHRVFIETLARQFGVKPRGFYDTVMSANKARTFLESVSPFLRIQKRAAALAIAFQVNRTPPVLQKNTERRRAREEQIVADLKEEFEKTHKKKRKPKSHPNS